MSFFSLVLLRWRAFPPGLGLDLQKTCFLRRQPRTQTWDSWPLKEVPPNELGLTQSVLHGFDLTFFFSVLQVWGCTSLLCSWLLMMKMEEDGASPLHLYRWLHQVRHIHILCSV